jgi:putative ABC transport system permease protein
VAECLAEATRGGSGAQRSRIRRALVAGQVGLSLVLLIAAALLGKSFVRLCRVPAGFQPDNVLTFRLSLPEARYPEKTGITAFYRDLLDRLRSLPGVRGAGASSGLPLAVPSGDWGFDVEGRPVGPRHEAAADWFAVTPGYFETMGIGLVEGRFPDRTDTDRTEPVIFLNETAARATFPRGDAVGQRIRLGGQIPQPWYRIAGIVGDVRHQGLASSPIPEMYIPHDQFRHFMPGTQARSMTVVIKAAVAPRSLTDAIRGEVRRLDPEIALSQVRTMEEVISNSVADRRLQLALLGAFGLLALALAVVGIYGVMAYHVSERRREVGIRMALGASASDVIAEVVGNGMRLVGLGILLGGAAAYAISGSMQRLLFRVSPTDWTTFVVSALVLAAAGVLACYLPARRASRLVPIEALQERGS